MFSSQVGEEYTFLGGTFSTKLRDQCFKSCSAFEYDLWFLQVQRGTDKLVVFSLKICTFWLKKRLVIVIYNFLHAEVGIPNASWSSLAYSFTNMLIPTSSGERDEWEGLYWDLFILWLLLINANKITLYFFTLCILK